MVFRGVTYAESGTRRKWLSGLRVPSPCSCPGSVQAPANTSFALRGLPVRPRAPRPISLIGLLPRRSRPLRKPRITTTTTIGMAQKDGSEVARRFEDSLPKRPHNSSQLISIHLNPIVNLRKRPQMIKTTLISKGCPLCLGLRGAVPMHLGLIST